jgi:hypothetical protein
MMEKLTTEEMNIETVNYLCDQQLIIFVVKFQS